MPIIDIELVCRSEAEFAEVKVSALADALGRALGSAPHDRAKRGVHAMQKIGPCLWFDNQAEEAANFYVAIFKNSRILRKTHYVDNTHRPAGSVLTVQFVLDGEEIVALNGGPHFKFTPGLQRDVVQQIAAWMLAQQPRQAPAFTTCCAARAA